jgi:hypothetical protein
MVDGMALYGYLVINNSPFAITSVVIGLDHVSGLAELRTPPRGRSLTTGIPRSNVASPAGWAARIIPTEDTDLLHLEWKASSPDSAIAPGKPQAFSVLVPQADASYTSSHWTVYVNGAGTNYYTDSLTLAIDATQPAKIQKISEKLSNNSGSPIVVRVQEPPCTTLHQDSPSQLLSSFDATAKTEWLSHGTGCYAAPEIEGERHCDFETTIKQDTKIDEGRRLIIANSNHLTGSGAYDYLIVFACVGDAIKVVLFEEFFYGVTVESVTPNRIAVTGGHRAKGDANASPSGDRHVVYDWSPNDFAYVSTERITPKAPLE